MTPESQIKKEIKKYLESIGAFWSAVTGGGYSKPGDPDLIACFHGRYIAIEAKTPTGVQSPIQKKRMAEIKEAGGVYILARSVEDVAEVIEDLWAEQDYDI